MGCNGKTTEGKTETKEKSERLRKKGLQRFMWQSRYLNGSLSKETEDMYEEIISENISNGLKIIDLET